MPTQVIMHLYVPMPNYDQQIIYITENYSSIYTRPRSPYSYGLQSKPYMWILPWVMKKKFHNCNHQKNQKIVQYS